MPKVANSTSLLGSFTCRKFTTWTDGFTSPLKEAVLRIFSPEKSNGFGQVGTCKLGYQRPARLPLDHWSCFCSCIIRLCCALSGGWVHLVISLWAGWLRKSGLIYGGHMRFFSSLQHWHWFCGPPSIPYSGYWGLFNRGKMAGAWHWPLPHSEILHWMTGSLLI